IDRAGCICLVICACVKVCVFITFLMFKKRSTIWKKTDNIGTLDEGLTSGSFYQCPCSLIYSGNCPAANLKHIPKCTEKLDQVDFKSCQGQKQQQSQTRIPEETESDLHLSHLCLG
ncbi:mCG145139, partial [Mus musculus]